MTSKEKARLKVLATREMERNLARYDKECGEVFKRQATPEEIIKWGIRINKNV
jgi:hypothetical protein